MINRKAVVYHKIGPTLRASDLDAIRNLYAYAQEQSLEVQAGIFDGPSNVEWPQLVHNMTERQFDVVVAMTKQNGPKVFEYADLRKLLDELGR